MRIMWGLTTPPPQLCLGTLPFSPLVCVAASLSRFQFLKGMGCAPFLLQGLCTSYSLTQEYQHSLNRWLCLLQRMGDLSAQRSFPSTSVHIRSFHPPTYSPSSFTLHPPLLSLLSCLSAQASLNQPHIVPSKAPRFPLNWCRLPHLEHPSIQHLNCDYFVNSRRVGAIYWPGLCPEGFHRDWHSMSLL